MEEIVYQQIRNEMTATFASFRQLQMGQYVVVAALITTILSFSWTLHWVSVGAGVALGGLILGVTQLGAEWFSAATRLGAYLLVAYELPGLEGCEKAHESDRRHLWILANRSESLKTLREKYPGKHSFGTGLRTFYWHQVFLSVFCLIVATVPFASLLQQPGFLKYAAAGVAALLLFDIGLCVVKAVQSQSGDLGKSQLIKWHEYLKDRGKYDLEFIRFMNL